MVSSVTVMSEEATRCRFYPWLETKKERNAGVFPNHTLRKTMQRSTGSWLRPFPCGFEVFEVSFCLCFSWCRLLVCLAQYCLGLLCGAWLSLKRERYWFIQIEDETPCPCHRLSWVDLVRWNDSFYLPALRLAILRFRPLAVVIWYREEEVCEYRCNQIGESTVVYVCRLKWSHHFINQ